MRPTRFPARLASVFAAAASAAVFVAAAAARPAAAQAGSPFAGIAGAGDFRYFFALDFRDFPDPQFYAFEYRSAAPSLTFAQVLQGLTGVPGFSIQTRDFGGTLGLALDGITFDGKTKFNDFAGNNSGEPNGYWSQWNSPDGVNWSENPLGISNQGVGAGTWVGASWVADFVTTTPAAPRVSPAAVAASAAVPEPGAAGLLALGVGAAGVAARRRRRRG